MEWYRMQSNQTNADFNYSIDADSSTVYLNGSITDKFSIELSSFGATSCIRLDFENIRMINSRGILNFIRFLQGLSESQILEYHNVPAAIINQMSLVNGIIGPRFRVISFFVPYTPKDSDDQFMIKLNIEEVRETGKLPPKKHPETKSLLLPDVNEVKFLHFLKF
jgi:hypothetical protein